MEAAQETNKEVPRGSLTNEVHKDTTPQQQPPPLVLDPKEVVRSNSNTARDADYYLHNPLSRTTSPNSNDSDLADSRDSTGEKRKRRRGGACTRGRKRPIILQVLLSISFIALMIAVLAALVPSFTLWVTSLRGLEKLQTESLNDAMTMRCTNIRTTVEANINNCERELRSVAGWAGRKVDSALAQLGVPTYGRSSPPLDLVLNETMFGSMTLQIYGQWATAFAVFVEEGMYLITSRSDWGPVLLIQTDWGENYSTVAYFYFPDDYAPNWAFEIHSSLVAFNYHAGLTDEILASLPSSLYWSPLEIPQNTQAVTQQIFAGLILPSTQKMVGVIAAAIMPDAFLNLFNDSITEGMLCAFIQDQDGCLVSSSCESASREVNSNIERVCTVNSTLWEIRDSSSMISDIPPEHSDAVIIVEKSNYTVAFLQIQSNEGFKAVVTVIAGIHQVLRTNL
ncbi:hypothetical protein Pelo_18952 [Pelomyxa schiedti]|nr:hypothetical protein Pelo_18952 [Pelomyxa schiedti]